MTKEYISIYFFIGLLNITVFFSSILCRKLNHQNTSTKFVYFLAIFRKLIIKMAINDSFSANCKNAITDFELLLLPVYQSYCGHVFALCVCPENNNKNRFIYNLDCKSFLLIKADPHNISCLQILFRPRKRTFPAATGRRWL